MEKLNISFFAMNFILLFAAIGFILAAFELHRLAFVFELMVLLVFLFISIFAMFVIYHNKKWGWTILGAALILLMINLFFIFLFTGIFETAHFTTLFFSVIGLAIALLNLRGAQEYEASEEEHGKAKDYSYIDKMEPVPKIDEQNISKTFIPGKYLASRKSNKYHVAKCDWAKKISTENQLWFNSEEEAKSKGFEADECIAA